MARTNGGKGPKQVAALTHEEAARKNIPTAELQPIAERMEEMAPVAPARFPRRTPLPEGETRERDPDLDPQIVWNGARLCLSPEEVRRLVETGEVEIGGAALVWRGRTGPVRCRDAGARRRVQLLPYTSFTAPDQPAPSGDPLSRDAACRSTLFW